MTELREIFRYLSEIKARISYNHSNKTLLIANADLAFLSDLGVESVLTGEGGVIQINTSQLPIYYSVSDFIQYFDATINKGDFGILETNVYFDSITNNYISESVPDAAIVRNNVYYIRIKEFLSTPSETNNFCNYHDPVNRKIICLSGIKGTLIIGYPNQNPQFGIEYDLSVFYIQLINDFSGKGFIELFKSEVYDTIKSIEAKDRLPNLIKNLKLIFENTNRNYDVYLSNFSFDALKDKLRQAKVNYFNLTKDILAKIYSQITSLPLTLVASLFASDKITGRLTPVVIWIIYTTYTWFALRLIQVLTTEIESIFNDFNSEKETIIKDCKLDSETIQKEVRIIQTRIEYTSRLLEFTTKAFVLMYMLLCLFMVKQLFHITWDDVFPINALKLFDSVACSCCCDI